MKAGTAVVVVTVVVLAFATYRLMSEQSSEPEPRIESTESAPSEGSIGEEGSVSEDEERRAAVRQQRRERDEEIRALHKEAQDELQNIRIEAQGELLSLKRSLESGGVDRNALESYRPVAGIRDQMTAWSEFEACLPFFEQKYEYYKLQAVELTRPFPAWVEVGGIKETIAQMTCVEVLRSSFDYAAKDGCDRRYQSVLETREEMAREQERCLIIGQRAGLTPNQVGEILSLP